MDHHRCTLGTHEHGSSITNKKESRRGLLQIALVTCLSRIVDKRGHWAYSGFDLNPSFFLILPLFVPLLQHHQYPNHGAVVTSMFVQMLFEQFVDKVSTNDVT